MKAIINNKTYLNLFVFFFVLFVILFMIFDFKKDFHLDMSEFNSKVLTTSDVEKIKEFDKNFGEPLFLSYFVYLKDGTLSNPTENRDFLKKYLLEENMSSLNYLKGIFKDFEEASFEDLEVTTVSSNTLLRSDSYVFDVKSFNTLEVVGIYAEEEFYKVVLKSSSGVYYEFDNLSAVYDIKPKDILQVNENIGIGKGQVHMSMYILTNGEKEYINPYNFLLLSMGV